MITGLVAITPAAGYVNGWGAIAIGIIASTIVYFALNYLSRLRPVPQRRRHARRDLHARVRRPGRRPLVGIFADPNMAVFYTRPRHGWPATGSAAGSIHGNWTLLKWQLLAAAVRDRLVGDRSRSSCSSSSGVFIPLRMSEENMEIGDTAEHGHEVYPVRRAVARVPERGPRTRAGDRSDGAVVGVSRLMAPSGLVSRCLGRRPDDRGGGLRPPPGATAVSDVDLAPGLRPAGAGRDRSMLSRRKRRATDRKRTDRDRGGRQLGDPRSSSSPPSAASRWST